MKSIKSKILVFLSFLFSIFFVGSAFSAYIFSERTNLHTDKANGLMDDIDINYELDANAYTVYFFPSSKWADYMKANPKPASQSLDDYLSVDNYKNYLKTEVFKNSDETNNPSDDDIAKIYGYFPDDEDPYGYKVRYADTCISTDTFDQMPIPLTTEKDSEGYYVRFSGWTANFANAIEYGYKSQGTFDYISSYDELSSVVKGQDIYENASINIPKHTLFVFPVLTSGKDYNSKSSFNKQTVVRIHDRQLRNVKANWGNDLYFERELYFSQEDTDNNAYYFYNNLKVKENERLYLDFDLKSNGEWINFNNKVTEERYWNWVKYDYHYYNSQVTKRADWDGDKFTGNPIPYPKDTDKELTPLFDSRKNDNGTYVKPKENGGCAVNEPGIYNIYVYVCENGKENTNAELGFNKKKLDNSSLVWYEDTSTKDFSSPVATKDYGSKYSVYVKIEKIIEFGLSGGRTKSLQYVDALQMNVMPRKNASTSRYYVLNNVFLEGTNINETVTATNKNDGSFYSYPSNISTILMNDGSPIELGSLTASSTQLGDFQEDYKGIYGESNYQFTEIYNDKSPHYSPYRILSVPESGVKNMFGNTTKNVFFRPEKSGFYCVVAKITITPTKTGVAHVYQLNYDKNSEIALCLGTQIYTNIFLYNNGDTIKKADDKFIDVKDTGNWYAKANSVAYGDSLTYSTEFTLKDGSKKTLREILGVSGTTAANHLTNHLTGREFKFNTDGRSIPLRRNYAFYIMPGAWQEGELN